MSKFDKLLKELNDLKIVQQSMDWAESIPDSIWENDLKENSIIKKEGLFVDKHRWYETSVTVIEIYGRLLGIDFVSGLNSESMSVEDVGHEIQFYQMDDVVEVTYKIHE